MLPATLAALRLVVASLTHRQLEHDSVWRTAATIEGETLVSRNDLIHAFLQLNAATLPCSAVWQVLPLWLRSQSLAIADRIAG